MTSLSPVVRDPWYCRVWSRRREIVVSCWCWAEMTNLCCQWSQICGDRPVTERLLCQVSALAIVLTLWKKYIVIRVSYMSSCLQMVSFSFEQPCRSFKRGTIPVAEPWGSSVRAQFRRMLLTETMMWCTAYCCHAHYSKSPPSENLSSYLNPNSSCESSVRLPVSPEAPCSEIS